MKTRTLLGSTLFLATVLITNSAALAAPAPADKTLWVSDDVNVTIYNITLDGTVLSSFHSGSISELTMGVGADADTLWAAKEGSNLIIHFGLDGSTLSSFSGATYDPTAQAPEGVGVTFPDGTLWIVDDDTAIVYHVQQDGTLINSFPTSNFDAAATSCQGIAADNTDGTLWLADNVTHRVYNVTLQGALIASFPASAFGPTTLNLQGIEVDDADGSLWLTARNTHMIYHVSRVGVLKSTLDTAIFGSLNPTGIAIGQAQGASFQGLIADIAGGMAAGSIKSYAGSKLTSTMKEAQKQIELGHETLAKLYLIGFQIKVYLYMFTGQVKIPTGKSLLASAADLIDSL